MAPLPKAIMTVPVPVAMPGRSGNHLIKVETGEVYPRPKPIPPNRDRQTGFSYFLVYGYALKI
jgi:hypothetical protein